MASRTERIREKSDDRKSHVQLSVLLAGASAGLFLLSPRAGELPGALLGMVAFALVQVVSPQCRCHRGVLLSPGNIGQTLFGLQLLLVPLLMSYNGIYAATLPYVPSRLTLNGCCAIQAIAYVAFCLGFRHAFMRGTPTGSAPTSTGTGGQPDSSSPLAPALVVLYAGVGIAGVMLYFGGPGGFFAYATSSALYKTQFDGAAHTSFAEAAGNVMRPFLAWSVVILWSRSMEHWAQSRALLKPVLVTLATVVLVVLANFSFNRGTMIAPIVAIAAAFSIRVHRIPLWALLCVGTAGLWLALIFGSARAHNTQLQRMADPSSLAAMAPGAEDASNFFQQYLNAPQYGAYLLDRTDDGGKLYFGQTLGASLLYSIPVLGRPFRPYSGTAIFNAAIYGVPGIRDQNVPLSAELFINFHIVGVVLGFVVLGLAAAHMERQMEESRNALYIYARTLVAIWILFCIPGALSASAQSFIYSFWPLYLWLVAHRIFLRRTSMSVVRAAMSQGAQSRSVLHRRSAKEAGP